MSKLIHIANDFRDDESGIATAWALSWIVLCFAIAGLSIDVTNAWKVKQVLQSTADVAAHAGAVELGQHDNDSIEAAVEAEANAYAFENMNPGLYGDALIENDIIVGFWDHDTKTFTPMVSGDVDIPNAVRAITRQDGTAGASNSIGTFFLRFVWKQNFKASSLATVQRFVSQCERDGMFASGELNGSAIQNITEGYCWHGETGITFAQQHNFEFGTIAGTADLSNCGPSLTSCEDAHNPGVEDALRQQTIANTKVTRIATYLDEYQDPYSDQQPDYITNMTVNYIDARTFDAQTDIVVGAVNIINNCSSGQNVSLGAAPSGPGNSGTSSGASNTVVTLSEFVLVGLGCDFGFDQTVHYEDAVIATTSTSRQTISGSAGVVLGRDDNCTPGGEVVIVTAGDAGFAAQLEAYDIEMIVAGDLGLSSQGQTQSTHEGSNFYVGGDIKITSQHTFAGCNGETSTTLDTKWSFRLVE